MNSSKCRHPFACMSICVNSALVIVRLLLVRHLYMIQVQYTESYPSLTWNCAVDRFLIVCCLSLQWGGRSTGLCIFGCTCGVRTLSSVSSLPGSIKLHKLSQQVPISVLHSDKKLIGRHRYTSFILSLELSTTKSRIFPVMMITYQVFAGTSHVFQFPL